jgi:hypothetical protein
MGGERRGLWYDFQTNSGGNLLTLIEQKINLDFKGALEYAGKLLGLLEQDLAKIPLKTSSKNEDENKTRTADQANPIKTQNGSKSPKVKEFSLSEHQLKMRHYARKLEHTSLPAKNTLVERYLREHRKINITLPSGIRFHPRVWDSNTKKAYPAMVVIAKDKNNVTQAVQVTYLDPNTAKKAQIEQPKRTFGSLRGAAVKINSPFVGNGMSGEQNKLPQIALAEGIETALSIGVARPDLQVYATLGVSNFANFQLGADESSVKRLLICADNDGKNSDSQKLVDRITKKNLEQGVEVIIAQPPKEGQDFNDVLRTDGIHAVYEIINTAENKEVSGRPINENPKENIKDLVLVYDIVAQESQKALDERLRIRERVLNVRGNTNVKIELQNTSDSNFNQAISNADIVDISKDWKTKDLNHDLERG